MIWSEFILRIDDIDLALRPILSRRLKAWFENPEFSKGHFIIRDPGSNTNQVGFTDPYVCYEFIKTFIEPIVGRAITVNEAQKIWDEKSEG
jgi:hypothetical protein